MTTKSHAAFFPSWSVTKFLQSSAHYFVVYHCDLDPVFLGGRVGFIRKGIHHW